MQTNFIRSLLLLAIIVYGSSGFSQNKVIDSLKLELQNHNEKDSIRVDLLYDLAFSLYNKDTELTNKYIKEAELINNQINYEKGKAQILSLKGIMANRASNYALGLEYFEKPLHIFESLTDKKGIASSYNSIGICYLKQSKNIEALSALENAYILFKELGAKNQLVAGSLNLANIYAKMGNYPEAIHYYKETLTTSREINHEYGIPYALNGLGHIYSEQANYQKALDYYHEALIYKEQIGDTIGMAISLNSLGNRYRDIGKLDKSLEYHNRSIRLAETIGNKDLVASNKGNIGILHKTKGNYNKALTYINESLRISREIDDLGQMTNCFYSLGEIEQLRGNFEMARENFNKSIAICLQNNNRYSLGINYLSIAESYFKEKNFNKALDYALKGKTIADELNLLEAQTKSSELLSGIYENKQNYNGALSQYKQFKTLNDSLFSKENIEKIAQIEYEYKYKQQVDSLSINELKLTKTIKATSQHLEKTQRNLFLGVIGFLVMALILGSIIFFLKLRHEKAKTQNIAIEQKLLRSQMTPHFIFNSLSVLQGMILNKEDKKSMFYLSKFSKLLRITLENSRDKLVPLSQELEAINNYLELQNLEASQSYDYTILVDKNIDESHFLIPPMLIQPFIENAIEHAFKGYKENRKIDIQLKYLDKELICTIIDNGIGIDTSNGHKNTDKKSLATTITSERLKILSRDFNINGAVNIEDRKKYNEQGTLVTLVIPYKLEDV